MDGDAVDDPRTSLRSQIGELLDKTNETSSPKGSSKDRFLPNLADIIMLSLGFKELRKADKEETRKQIKDFRDAYGLTWEEISVLMDVIESLSPDARTEILDWIRSGLPDDDTQEVA